MHLVKNLIGNCWAALFPPLASQYNNKGWVLHLLSFSELPYLSSASISAAPPIDLHHNNHRHDQHTNNNNETFFRSAVWSVLDSIVVHSIGSLLYRPPWILFICSRARETFSGQSVDVYGAWNVNRRGNFYGRSSLRRNQKRCRTKDLGSLEMNY